MRNPFTEDDFVEFITIRQKNIKDSIEGLLIKQRLDLSLNYGIWIRILKN